MLIVKSIIGLVFLFAGALLAWDPSAQANRPFRYNHQHPKHQSIGCAKCHVISAAQIDVTELPGHITCVSCHNFAVESMKAGNGFCGVCHREKAVSKADLSLFKFPKPGIESEFEDNFSHPSHLKQQSIPIECEPTIGSPAANRCVRCHQPTSQAKASEPEIKTAAGHAACFQCHCEKPVKLPGMFDCQECHKLGWPSASSIFGKISEFKHSDHEFDTRPRRKRDGLRAKTLDSLCAECHQSAINAVKLTEIKLPEEKNCVVCHTGRPGLPAKLSVRTLDELKR